MIKQLQKLIRFLNKHRQLVLLPLFLLIVALSFSSTKSAQAAPSTDDAPGNGTYPNCTLNTLGIAPSAIPYKSWNYNGHKYQINSIGVNTASTGICEINLSTNKNAGSNNVYLKGPINELTNLQYLQSIGKVVVTGTITDMSDFFRSGSSLKVNTGQCGATGIGGVWYCITIAGVKPTNVWLGVPKQLIPPAFLSNPNGDLYKGQYGGNYKANGGNCIPTYVSGGAPPTWLPSSRTPPMGATNQSKWPIYLWGNCNPAGYANDGAIVSINAKPLLCIGMGYGSLSDFGIASMPPAFTALGPYPKDCGSTVSPIVFGPGGNVGQANATPGTSFGNAGYDFIEDNCNPGFTDKYIYPYGNYSNKLDCDSNDFRWYKDYWLGHNASPPCAVADAECITPLIGTDVFGNLKAPGQIRIRLKSTIIGGGESLNMLAEYPLPTTTYELFPDSNVSATPTSSGSDTAENPTKITFSSSVTAQFGPGATKVNGIDVTREYYYVKAGIRHDVFNGTSSSQTITNDPTNGWIAYPGDTIKTTVTIQGWGLSAGDRVCAVTTVAPAQGTVDPLTGAHSNTIDASKSSDPDCVNIVDEPYLKFYGSDVLVGGHFDATDCTTATNPNYEGGIIKTIFNNDGSNTGSSVQFAAQAYGVIRQFTSANLGGADPIAQPPIGLAFANVNIVNLPSTDSRDTGGSFGDCMQMNDYFKSSIGLPTDTSTTNIALDSMANGRYLYKPPAAANNELKIDSADVPNGKHLFIYVDGDVYIHSNIKDFGDPSPSWSDTSAIPLVYVVAKGNIYIDQGVDTLDGIYVAQPDSSSNKGIIYTCASSSGPFIVADGQTGTTPYLPGGGCHDNNLTVNGTFVAQEVKFLRTGNSLRDSTSAEQYNNSHAAEIFNFSPEFYTVNICNDNVPSFGVLCSGGSGGGDNTITSLPPIL